MLNIIRCCTTVQDTIYWYTIIQFPYSFKGTLRGLCPAKTYSSLGLGNCAECPAGFKCSRAGLSEPEDCERGYYNNATGQAACSKCEAGRECLNGKESIPCQAGYYSREGESNCTKCSTGTYSLSSASFCIQCPEGNKCIDGSLPVNCSEGYFSRRGAADCELCPVGAYKSYYWMEYNLRKNMGHPVHTTSNVVLLKNINVIAYYFRQQH